MNLVFENISNFAIRFVRLDLCINLILKGSIILIAAGLANVLLRQSSAAIRHWIWSAAFLCLFFMPLLSNILPKKPLHVLPPKSISKTILGSRAEIKVKSKAGVEIPVKVHHHADNVPVVTGHSAEKSLSLSPSFQENASSKTNLNGALQPKEFEFPWQVVIFVIWVSGAMFLMARMVIRILGLWWISRTGQELLNKDWLKTLEYYLEHCNINRPVKIIMDKHILIPATFGFIRPVLFIPDKAIKWSKEKRDIVLLHELAHVKRWDYLTNLVSQIVCVFYWFNPLVWVAARQLQREREKAVDDFVLRAGMENCDYANHLLEIVRNLPLVNRYSAYAIGMPQQSELKTRFKHILTQKIQRNRLSRTSMLVSLIIILSIVLPLTTAKLQERTASKSLQKVAEGGLADIINDLENGAPDVQKRAAWALGDREDPRSVPALIEALEDDNPEVRAMAAWALGEIKEPRAFFPLIDAISDENDYAREMIVKAVGEYENKRAVSPLSKVLKDRNPDVRYSAVWALGEIHDHRAVEAVKSMLNDSSVNVREMAVSVLGEVGSVAEVHSLLPMLADNHPKIRRTAAHALGHHKDPRAVEDLVSALSDDEPAVRIAAAQALGEIGDSRAVDALLNLLRDKDPEVRAVAVWALDEVEMD